MPNNSNPFDLPLPFMSFKKSISNEDLWTQLYSYMKGFPEFCDMGHHIEAKALSVISISRRLISTSISIGNNLGWKRSLIETFVLLFPMLELIGSVRLGTKSTSDASLSAGAEWLLDPQKLPSVDPDPSNNQKQISSLVQYMQDHQTGPEIKDFIILRNYFLHGLKSATTNSLPDIINAELPYAIALRSTECLKVYWNQLRFDDGSQGWLDRLANAKIIPFIIKGSGIFDYGLIDPDILDWITS